MSFKSLHHQPQPLLLVNVWDVMSARVAEQQNASAIGTSSAAIAAMLGYRDGEQMRFSELKYVVERIRANTPLPLTVDLEAGYSRQPTEIADHVRQLVDLGVVGINMEDSTVDPQIKRTLVPARSFAQRLASVKDHLGTMGEPLFWNVRTDAFLMGHPTALAETQERIRHYERSGADGIFVPGLVKEEDIAAVVAATPLPINVMALPELLTFARLQALGVKRISMGNFLFSKMYNDLEQRLHQVLHEPSLAAIF